MPLNVLHKVLSTIAALGLGALAGMAPAAAQDTPPELSVELNTARDDGASCLISFMVENRLGADLSSVVFETVLFDAQGNVAELTLFDFRDLPQGRPRMRQFRIDGSGCAGISRVLVNGAQSCTGEGLAAGACMDGLTLRSRTDIDLIG